MKRKTNEAAQADAAGKRPSWARTGFDLRAPWVQALLLLACIPLFPDYFAPPLALIACVCARRDTALRKKRLRVGTAGALMLVYLAFMTVHLVWARPFVMSFGTVLMWGGMFGAYLALANTLTDRFRIETALLMLSIVSGLLGLLACAQYGLNAVLGKPFPLQLWDFVDIPVYELFPVPVSVHSLGPRAGATFFNPNMYAEWAVLGLPFIAAYGFTGERSAAKITARLSLLFTVMGVLFTFSRGCYLAIGAIAIVMCIANLRRLIPILIVASSVVLLIPETVYSRLLSVGSTSDIAILERFDVWGVAMQVFLEHPLFGGGAGMGTVWDRLAHSGIGAPHAHNLFIQWLAEGGVFALVLLFFLLWKLFRVGFEMIMDAPDMRMYGAAVIAFCGGLCVCGMFDYPLSTPKLIGTFLAVLALIDAFGHTELRRPLYRPRQLWPFETPPALKALRRRQRSVRAAKRRAKKRKGDEPV